METQNERERLLGQAPIPRLMVKLAIPAIIAQLINILYNIVDRIYIGHIPVIGDLALTGLGVSFPIITLISAFSAFAGAGGAPLAAIQMGRGDNEKAQRILANSAVLLLIFSVALTVIFQIYKTPLLYMFGASDNTIIYANQYLGIYLCGTIFVQLALGLNMFISCQGQANTAMLSVLIGAVTNIVLDPILIFGFDMGVRGAAIATIFSQALSCVWVVRFLTSEKSALRIQRKYMRPDPRIIGKIGALGISPFIMQATESAISVVLNSGLQKYGGDLYVASMTILQSVMQLIFIPIQGFTQGVQPIMSYNFGAGQFDRVKKTFKIMTMVTFSTSTCFCLLAVFFPEIFASVFTPKAELVALVGQVLPIYIAGMWIFGVQMSCQSTFMALGQAKTSLFIALLRKVILLIPLAIILPRFYGVMGIYYAEPIADTTSAICAGLIFLFTHKRILSEKNLEKI